MALVMERKDLLHSQLLHAYQTVKYYKQLFDCYGINPDNPQSFYKIPLLHKNEVMQDENSYISDKYRGKCQSGDLLLKRTSGSTGKCMNVYWLPSDYFASNLEAWRYRTKWYGVSITDKYARFHSTIYINGTVIRAPKPIIKKGNVISFDKSMLNEDYIHLYIREMRDFKPIWMSVQPSVLHAMLESATSDEIRILNDIKYIEFISEYLHDNMRNHFQKTLPNVVLGNLYGTTETGCIALECPHGNQHILNNTLVETFNDNYTDITSDEGNIVLTSLCNSAMPLIRYCIGDKGRIIEQSDCMCGFNGASIILTLGREFDIIELPNGEKRHSSVFWQIIEEVSDEYPESITQFYVIQDGISSITVHLFLTDRYMNWRGAIETTFKTSLQRHLSKDINCKFKYNDKNILHDRNKLNIYTKLFDKI